MRPALLRVESRHACESSFSHISAQARRPLAGRFLSTGALAVLTLLAACHDTGSGTDSNPTGNSGGSSGVGSGSSSGGSGSTTPPAVAPSITSQPGDQSITVGQGASFSVTASGTAPLTYQWQRDGAAIAGATGSAYSLSSTTLADSGAQFTVVVTNSAGSATSNAAKLTVNVAGTAVTAATGGQVKSADGRVTLTIPPGGLTADATVSISSTADWTIPAALANQFKVIPGTTYVIATQGGALDPSTPSKINFSTLGLPAPQSTGKGTSAKSAAPSIRVKSGSHGLDSGAVESSDPDNLGLSQDCGDGKPLTGVLAPGDGGYDPGTLLVGCPLGSGGSNQSSTTVSLSSWTPTTQAAQPSGINLWQSFTPRTVDTIGFHESPSYIRSWTGADTWMGATPTSLSASQVGTAAQANEQSLMTLVEVGTGNIQFQGMLPISAKGIALDGPASFYALIGPFLDSSSSLYVARYQLQWQNGTTQLAQAWEHTLTSVPTTLTGNDPFADGVTGGSFALDPTTGDLLVIAGPGNSPLSDDDIARLGTSAPAFLERFDRDGNIVWVTPLVPDQATGVTATNFTLRMDHLGNAYVAANGCCTADSPAPLNVPGLVLEKIDAQGKLSWISPISTAAFGEGLIAVDNNNDAYVTYENGAQHLSVSKVAADTGVATPLGDVDPAAATGAGVALLSNMIGSTYIDDNGNLYFWDDEHAHLIVVDPTLKLLHSDPMHFPFFGQFQVDSSGNIFDQYAGQFSNGDPTDAATPNVCGANVSATTVCYGVYLREFHF
jgi:hypothetical protein